MVIRTEVMLRRAYVVPRIITREVVTLAMASVCKTSSSPLRLTSAGTGGGIAAGAAMTVSGGAPH